MQNQSNLTAPSSDPSWSHIIHSNLPKEDASLIRTHYDALWPETVVLIQELTAKLQTDSANFMSLYGRRLIALFDNKVLFCNDKVYSSPALADLLAALIPVLLAEPAKDHTIKYNLLKSINHLNLKKVKSSKITLTGEMLDGFLRKWGDAPQSDQPTGKEVFKSTIAFLKSFTENWNNDSHVIDVILNAKVKSSSQRFHLINSLLKIKFLNVANFKLIEDYASRFSTSQLLEHGYFLENLVSSPHLANLSEELVSVIESSFNDLFSSLDALRRPSNNKKPFKKHTGLVNLIIATLKRHNLDMAIERKLTNYLLQILQLFKQGISKKGQNQDRNQKHLFIDCYHDILKKHIAKVKNFKHPERALSEIEADLKRFAFEFFLFLIPLNVADEVSFKNSLLLMKKTFGQEFRDFVKRKVTLINEKEDIKKEILINFMAKCGFLLWDINDEDFLQVFESKIEFLITKERNPINEKIHEYYLSRIAFIVAEAANPEFEVSSKDKMLSYFTKVFDNNYVLNYSLDYRVLLAVNFSLSEVQAGQLLEMALSCCHGFDGDIDFESSGHNWPTLKSIYAVLFRVAPTIVAEYITNIIANLVTVEKFDEHIFRENFKTKEVKVFLKMALSFPTKALIAGDNFAEFYFLLNHLLAMTNLTWTPMYKEVAKRVIKMSVKAENSKYLEARLQECLQRANELLSIDAVLGKRSEFLLNYSVLNYLTYTAEDAICPISSSIRSAINQLNQNVYVFLKDSQTFDSYLASVLALRYSPIQFEESIERVRHSNFFHQLKFAKKYPELACIDKPRGLRIIQSIKKNLRYITSKLFDRQNSYVLLSYSDCNAYFSFFNSRYKIPDKNYASGLTKFLKKSELELDKLNDIYQHLINSLMEDFNSIVDLNDIEESYIQILRNLLDNPFYIDDKSFQALTQIAKQVLNSKMSLEVKANFLMSFSHFALTFFGFINSSPTMTLTDTNSVNNGSIFSQILDNLTEFMVHSTKYQVVSQKLEKMLADGSMLDNLPKKITLAVFLEALNMSKKQRLVAQYDSKEIEAVLTNELTQDFPSVNLLYSDSTAELFLHKISFSTWFDVQVSQKFFTKLLEKLKEDIKHKSGSTAIQIFLHQQGGSGSFGFKKLARSLSHFAMLERALSVADEKSLISFLQIYNDSVLKQEENETLRIVISSIIFRLRNKGYLLSSFDDLLVDFLLYLSKNLKVKIFEPFVVFTGNVFRPKLFNFNLITRLCDRLLQQNSQNQALLAAYLMQYFRKFVPSKLLKVCVDRLSKLRELDSQQSYFAIIIIAQLLESYNSVKKLYENPHQINLVTVAPSKIDIEMIKKLIEKLISAITVNSTNQDYILLLMGKLEKFPKDVFLHESIQHIFDKILAFLDDSGADKNSKTSFLDNYQQQTSLRLGLTDSARYIEYVLDKMDKVQTNFSEQFLIIVYLKIVFTTQDFQQFQLTFSRLIRGRTFAVKQRAEDALKKAAVKLPMSLLAGFPATFKALKASIDSKDSVLLLNAFLPVLHTNPLLVNSFFAVTRELIEEASDDSARSRLKGTLNEFYYLKGRFVNLEEYDLDKELIDVLVDFSENISYFS